MPVVTSVSHATRPCGSCDRIASSTASEIWSVTLSGCPSVTDSDVNTCRLATAMGAMSRKRGWVTRHEDAEASKLAVHQWPGNAAFGIEQAQVGMPAGHVAQRLEHATRETGVECLRGRALRLRGRHGAHEPLDERQCRRRDTEPAVAEADEQQRIERLG